MNGWTLGGICTDGWIRGSELLDPTVENKWMKEGGTNSPFIVVEIEIYMSPHQFRPFMQVVVEQKNKRVLISICTKGCAKVEMEQANTWLAPAQSRSLSMIWKGPKEYRTKDQTVWCWSGLPHSPCCLCNKAGVNDLTTAPFHANPGMTSSLGSKTTASPPPLDDDLVD